ncbi:MAG: YtxH domain-containing protein [Candidatus Gastranaerophilales bacterium]|nr:YtxH domain-containing protein [Candidatus Gastranaerophilales bacterium]
MAKETDNSLCFGLGLLAGVIGGIIGGIFYAPKSGEETRADLIHKIKVIKNKFPKKIECAKRKSINSIEQTKASIENIIEDIQDSLKAKKLANAKIKESKSLKGEL